MMRFDFLRLPGCLTITTEQNATILAKNTNPAAELLCSGVRLCAEAAEKPSVFVDKAVNQIITATESAIGEKPNCKDAMG